MIFEVLMNLILINIFVQFVASNVTFNFIDSILLTIIYCVYGGLYAYIKNMKHTICFIVFIFLYKSYILKYILLLTRSFYMHFRNPFVECSSLIDIKWELWKQRGHSQAPYSPLNNMVSRW